jgi:c-di-GMP-binding flagellar brake protein YcgR
MESDGDKRTKESGVRNRRYSIRHPFAASAEMLELQSGTRVSGVTSDLSLGGCFLCARRTLEVGARVRGTLALEGQQVKILAVVRVVKPQVGMGLEFLDIERDSHATLLAWIGNLRKSR